MNNVKKLVRIAVIAVVFATIAVAGVVAQTPDVSDDPSDNEATLNITGYVPTIISISVSATQTDFDLSTARDLSAFATVTEVSNVRSGYRVTVSSANGGYFANEYADTGNLSGDTHNAVSYTLKYGDTTVDFSNGNGNTFEVTNLTDTLTPEVGTSRSLQIGYPDNNLSGGDDYSDTLTFNIYAK